MNNTVARPAGRARKPNRRPGATIIQLADRATAKRADTWAAAYRREQAQTQPWPARTAT